MVVVTVTYPGRETRRRVFAKTFSAGPAGVCDLELVTYGWTTPVMEIEVLGPDVRIGKVTRGTLIRLNRETIDEDFVHVLHVGDELEVMGHRLTFELVEGTPDDVRRFMGEASRELVPAELELLEALRSDPADAGGHEVYADYLDENGRSGEAEFVRLQLPRDKAVIDPEAFSSEWLSHRPRAVQVRLLDLSPLIEPARRALVSRPVVLCRRGPACPARWEELRLDEESDLLRWCGHCHVGVAFCSTFDDIQDRSRQRLPVAVDPGLVAERARVAFFEPNRDFDEPTNPWIDDAFGEGDGIT